MGAVLAAMEKEARGLLRGEPLRPEFWTRVVDFIGNFTHRVHRTKEERIFFPALREWGLLEPAHSGQLERSHGSLKDLTLLLCEGVGEGDWEKAFRVVAIYLGEMRPHLEAEEELLLSPHLVEISEERLEPVRRGFAAVEDEVIGRSGRRAVLDLVRSVCREVDLEAPLVPASPAQAPRS
jgi:hemerythrin-like domain-containing protein